MVETKPPLPIQKSMESALRLESEDRVSLEKKFRTCLLVSQDIVVLANRIKSHHDDGKDERLEYLEELELAEPIFKIVNGIQVLRSKHSQYSLDELYELSKGLLNGISVSDQIPQKNRFLSVELDGYSDDQLTQQIKAFHHDAKYIEFFLDIYKAYQALPESSENGISQDLLAKQRGTLLSIKLTEGYLGPNSPILASRQKKSTEILEKIESSLFSQTGLDKSDFDRYLADIEAAAINLQQFIETNKRVSSIHELSEWIGDIVKASSAHIHISWTPPQADTVPEGTVPIDKYNLIAYLQRNIIDNANKAYKVRPDRTHLGIEIRLTFDVQHVFIRISDFGSGFKSKHGSPLTGTGQDQYQPVDLESLESGWKSEAGTSVADSEGIGLLGVKNRLLAVGGDLKIYNRINATQNTGATVVDGADIEISLPITS